MDQPGFKKGGSVETVQPQILLTEAMTHLKDRSNPTLVPPTFLTLATLDREGFPALRTVVLRAFDVERRILSFHTDIRSTKIEQLRSQPYCSILYYDAARRWQYRFRCLCEIHHNDEAAKQAWLATTPSSRLMYASPHQPGSILREEDVWIPPLEVTLNDHAQNHFALVECQFDNMEWLSVSEVPHRRIRYHWAERDCSWEIVAP